MDELKPCPFCGGTNLNIKEADIYGKDDLPWNPKHVFRVECNALEGGCGTMGGYYGTKEEAIEAWKRRTTNDLNT